jgi:hypothetical protein
MADRTHRNMLMTASEDALAMLSCPKLASFRYGAQSRMAT